MEKISTCGLDCGECEAFETGCAGCRATDGKPPWLADMNQTVCPLHDCPVGRKGLEDCGQCAELPCRMYAEFRDPSVSEEQHLAAIAGRVDRLRELERRRSE